MVSIKYRCLTYGPGRLCVALSTLLIVVLFCAEALAAGFYLAPRGVRPLARAGAYVAGADDVNALSYNPAGMAFAAEGALVDFAYPVHSTTFTRQIEGALTSEPSVIGDGLGIPSPTFGAIYGFGLVPELRFGMSVAADYPQLQNWPLELESGVPAPQRYAIVDYKGTAVSKVSAGVSYLIADSLAVGASLQLLAGKFVTQVIASNCDGVICTQPENPDFDAAIQIDSAPFVVPGAQIGLTFVPWKWLRFGLSWETGYSLDEDATVRVRLPPHPMYGDAQLVPEEPSARVGMNFPMAARAGIEGRWGDVLRIEGTFVWEQWSVHDTLAIDVTGASIKNVDGIGDYSMGQVDIERNFRDTWSARLGAEISPMVDDVRPLTVRFGAMYEPSAIPDESMTPMVVDFDKVIIGSGVGYDFGELTVDVTYAYIFMPTRTVTTSEARQASAVRPAWDGRTRIGNGVYESSAHLVGAGMTLEF